MGKVRLFGVLGWSVIVWVLVGTAMAASPPTTAEEAKGLALVLGARKSESQVRQGIRYIMKRLGIKEIPTASLGKDIGISTAEVEIVARSFMEGNLVALDDLVSMYDGMGIRFTEAGKGQVKPKPFTVEKALRDLRTKAEKEKDNPKAFAVLLIDALANRKENAFKLLETHKPGCADKADDAKYIGIRGGPTRQGLMEEALKSVEEEDPGGSQDLTPQEKAMATAFLNAMMDNAAKARRTGTATSAGGFSAAGANALKPFTGDLAKGTGMTPAQLEGYLAQGLKGIPAIPDSAGIAPEVRALYDSIRQFQDDQRAGADTETLANDTIRIWRENRDQYSRFLNKLQTELTEKLAQVAKAGYEGAEAMARSVGGAQFEHWYSTSKMQSAHDEADFGYRTIKEAQDDILEEEREAKRLRLVIPRPNPDRSCLRLDPIQVLILQKYLLIPDDTAGTAVPEVNAK